MNKYPIGFMSYARADDEHDKGYLTEWRERLSGEVCAQTGERFDIFQDRNDIVARLIGMRNYVDWRPWRFDSLDTPAAKKMLARLAADIAWRSKGRVR